MIFVNLTKAFETVSRDGLEKIMAKFGCPPIFIAMMRQFHDGMQALDQNDGEYPEPFGRECQNRDIIARAFDRMLQAYGNYDLTISTKRLR